MSEIEGKITKISNSMGVTIPADMLKESGLSYGDQVQLKTKKWENHIKKNIQLPEGIDENFVDLLNGVIKEHDEAFKGLVER